MSTSSLPSRSIPFERAFLCPLRGRCLEVENPYPSIEALNAAVAEYKSYTEAAAKAEQARKLFASCVPLVRKALVRFCPFSQCRPGACLPEELVGETFIVFAQALDEYRPDSGKDFLGYATWRLWWGLRHEARRLRKALPASDADGQLRRDEQARILDRVFVEKLLAGLSQDNADLLRLRYTEGYSHRELATMAGVSDVAVRKRIQRLRDRLRAHAVVGA